MSTTTTKKTAVAQAIAAATATALAFDGVKASAKAEKDAALATMARAHHAAVEAGASENALAEANKAAKAEWQSPTSVGVLVLVGQVLTTCTVEDGATPPTAEAVKRAVAKVHRQSVAKAKKVVAACTKAAVTQERAVEALKAAAEPESIESLLKDAVKKAEKAAARVAEGEEPTVDGVEYAERLIALADSILSGVSASEGSEESLAA